MRSSSQRLLSQSHPPRIHAATIASRIARNSRREITGADRPQAKILTMPRISLDCGSQRPTQLALAAACVEHGSILPVPKLAVLFVPTPNPRGKLGTRRKIRFQQDQRPISGISKRTTRSSALSTRADHSQHPRNARNALQSDLISKDPQS